MLVVAAVSMVNGMTVNGLGEVSALGVDPTLGAVCNNTNNVNASLLGLGKQLSNYLILGTHTSNNQ